MHLHAPRQNHRAFPHRRPFPRPQKPQDRRIHRRPLRLIQPGTARRGFTCRGPRFSLKGRIMRLGIIHLIPLLLLLCARLNAAENTQQPNVKELADTGIQTLKKLSTTPASWTVRYGMPNGLAMQAKVIRDGARRFLDFALVLDGKPQKVLRLNEEEG